MQNHHILSEHYNIKIVAHIFLTVSFPIQTKQVYFVHIRVIILISIAHII